MATSGGSAIAAITTPGLVKRYGDVTALDGIDLATAPGSIHALLGPKGAGKTTAVNVLATLVRPDAGRVTVLDHDVVAEAATGLADLDLANAADRAVKGCSGGMRRRLGLAAVLVAHPRVLLLDEPTTGLPSQPRGPVEPDPATASGRSHGRAHHPVPRGDRPARRPSRRPRPPGHRGRGTSADLKARLGQSTVELHEADLAPRSLAVREPTLDDVLLALTGDTTGGRP